MLRVLISDTHYGWKQNSVTWMHRQLGFIYSQLIPYIQQLRIIYPEEKIVLYHLGDVFDSRSSINPMIANQVRQMFEALRREVDDMIILGGNHDYYSPSSDKDCAIDIVLQTSKDIHLVTHDIYTYGGDLFIPWNEYENIEKLCEHIDSSIQNIFVHADLPHIDDAHRELFKNKQVFSGHIHTPSQYNNLHTLGSSYALTFADSNSERGFYILNDQSVVQFIPNDQSIKFWRFYNDEIFDLDVSTGDYLEVYVDQVHMSDSKYTSQLSRLATRYKEMSIIPQIRPTEYDDCVLETYDIIEVCKSMIPARLQNKFQQIESKM